MASISFGGQPWRVDTVTPSQMREGVALMYPSSSGNSSQPNSMHSLSMGVSEASLMPSMKLIHLGGLYARQVVAHACVEHEAVLGAQAVKPADYAYCEPSLDVLVETPVEQYSSVDHSQL